MDLEQIKARLADVPGIDTLTVTSIGGRHVYGFDGLMAGIDPSSTEDQVVAAIRNAAALRTARIDGIGLSAVAGALNPPPLPQTKAPTMATSAPPRSGGFAAQLRSIIDEARDGVARTQDECVRRVRDKVRALDDVKDATVRVTDNMVTAIDDQVADAMAELGQISNDI